MTLNLLKVKEYTPNAGVRAVILALALAMPGCSPEPPKDNALLDPWSGPYGGVPAFDRMELADLKPALEAAMALKQTEIEAIVENPEPPTFDNTLVALEDAGRDLDRVEVYRGIWRSNLSSPEFREINNEMAPRLAEFNTGVFQNQGLFDRIQAIYASEAMANLDAEQRRLLETTYARFVRGGAQLTGAARERYAAINKELAELQNRFADNVLADEEKYVVYLKPDQLSGLPDSFIESAARAAGKRGHEGEYAVTNTRSSMDPFLTYSDQRDLRKKVWRNYYSRGDNGDEHDNNALIAKILQLRQERSALLDYDNYAAWRLEDRMAGTPENAMQLLMEVWPAAVARAGEEIADMRAMALSAGDDIKIEPWDYRYYAEKVRRARYDIDSEEVKQYLQLDRLREAMFYVARELFRFDFRPVPAGSVPVFHEDVRVWEVRTGDTGSLIGLWYLDPFARQGKRSGAWATSYRSHETVRGKQVILASNNSNFVPGEPGQPVLISWDDARTLFHEFGHALHALSSRVNYLSLNWGVRDYTEFQSQLLERWLMTDPVIDNYLVHVDTGEPIPAELVARIRLADSFNQGFATTEYLASALVDLMYHTSDPTDLDADAFERASLALLGMPDAIVMRHRSPHFGHAFSSEGYSAGYYGYIWADVLTADAAEAFAAAPGGFYDPVLARKLVDNLFAPRNAVDPAEAYRAFRGRDPDTGALMRDRGFGSADD